MDLHKPTNFGEKKFLTIDYYGKIESMDKSGLEKSLASAIYAEPCKYMINLINGQDYTIPSPVWASIPGFNGPGILWTGADCAPARVGIGTDSPISTIDVRGGAYISGATSIGVFHNSTAKLYVDQSNPSKNGLTVELTTGSPTYGGSAINAIVDQDNRKAFSVYNSSYNTDVFRVLGNGTVWATEMHVRLKEDFPDYVFSKNYRLISLDSLENFIVLNSRLPGMPSAEQVKTSGVELGEMNRILVEKVEELTLYMIELQKLIEQQQKKIAELEEKVN